ncbi:hypothetical protein GH714_043926 [Hevea brasiliensis]|uniref:Uncharacterized protein n=1 Tax=Hevea brasiliensis TaxID=3981 RepID=A0A6A6K1X5_HEVBR|nr:hypothetical protein GH714_043926 [Hevea brasiliensis]
MLMVQNRLMLTSGEAVIASRTSRFFDFFRYTVLATVDTDPFDVFADIEEVIISVGQHRWMVTWFCSPQTSSLSCWRQATNPTSAVIRPATHFKMTPGVKPAPSGDAILFAFDSGSYSGIREFFTDSYSDTKKAQPATSHVDKYIRGKSGVFIEVMDMGDELEYGLQDRVRMDRRATVTFTKDASSGNWYSSGLPWWPQDLQGIDAVLINGWDAYVGETYWFEVEPTPPLIKDKERVSYLDTPTVGNIWLNLDLYPDFSVVVTDKETKQERTVYLSNGRLALSIT